MPWPKDIDSKHGSVRLLSVLLLSSKPGRSLLSATVARLQRLTCLSRIPVVLGEQKPRPVNAYHD